MRVMRSRNGFLQLPLWHHTEDSEAEQQMCRWRELTADREEHAWQQLQGLCGGMERGFLQLSVHTRQETASVAPSCQERSALYALEPSCCLGEAGMAGAALCVCTCTIGCSWVVGKQCSSQRFLNWSDVHRMFIPEHLGLWWNWCPVLWNLGWFQLGSGQIPSS